MHRLEEEDPSIHYSRDPQTKELLLSGQGQLHIEVTVAKLKRRFGVDVNLKPPRIPYRETIKASTEAHGRHKKQTGGHGQFGDCKIKVEPLPRGTDFEFVDDIFGGSIPRQFVPAVEKGIQDARTRGYLAGYPMVDFRVTVFDGSYHDVDSNELSFKLAGSLAFKDAMTRARPTILEPIMNVEVYAPSDFAGDLMGDLNGRRGRIGGMDTRGAMTIIKAQVPMSEMLTYEQHLTSATGGRGSYHMEYSHYDEVPAHLQTKIIAAAKAERAGVEVEEVVIANASEPEARAKLAEEPRRCNAARGACTLVEQAQRRSALESCWRQLDCRRLCAASSTCGDALGRLRALAFGWSPPRPSCRASRSAAARRRPPTPFGFGVASVFFGVGFGLRARVELAADQLDLRDLGGVAPAEAEPQQARVAARPRREARRERVEQLGDDLAILHVLHDQAARVQRLAVGGAGREAALGDGDQPLDERPQLLRARHRRRQMLVAEQGRRLVPQHRNAMLGDAAQFSVCDSVSHDVSGCRG